MNQLTVTRYIPEQFSFLRSNKKVQYTDDKGVEHKLKSSKIIEMMNIFYSKYFTRQNDVFRKKEKKGLHIQLHSVLLRDTYGGRYHDIIKYLLHHKFFTTDGRYKVCKKAITYSLNTEMCNQLIKFKHTIPKKFTIHKQLYEHKPIIPLDIQQMLIEDSYEMHINREAALAYNREQNDMDGKRFSFYKNEYSIEAIAERILYHKFDKYGRMHTNFSVLKSEIRKMFLNLGGAEVAEVDVTNSQPIFLYKLMKSKGFTKWDGYDYDVLSGQIYTRIADVAYSEFGESKARKNAKKLVFHVFFGAEGDNKRTRIFKSLYPNVYEWMCAYKAEKENYAVVAHELQRLESDFIYSTVIRRIKTEKPNIPLVTVHDSIMYPEMYKEYIERVFNEEMNILLDRYPDKIDEIVSVKNDNQILC